jgi:stage III sporulation protein SpoIIIAA
MITSTSMNQINHSNIGYEINKLDSVEEFDSSYIIIDSDGKTIKNISSFVIRIARNLLFSSTYDNQEVLE